MWQGTDTHALSTLSIAFVVTVCISYTARVLASRRVALDELDSRSSSSFPILTQSSPLRSRSNRPHPFCASQASYESVQIVRVYWPVTQTENIGSIYGWSWQSHKNEFVVVVACVHSHTAPRPWTCIPSARKLGECIPKHNSPSSTSHTQRQPVLASLHELGPHVILCDAELAVKPHQLSFFLYAPPKLLYGQSLTLGIQHVSDPQASFTRLERLVAMDPMRFEELRSSKRTGSLRMAIQYMNMAHYACIHTPIPPRRACVHGLLNYMPHLHLPILPHCCAKYSLLWCVVQKRVAVATAWSRYIMHWNTLRSHLETDGSVGNDLHAMQHAQQTSWNALLSLALDLGLGWLLAHVLRRWQTVLVDTFRALLAYVDQAAFDALFNWLVHWPLGIKLNHELALFLADTLGSITLWYSMLQRLFDTHVPWFVHICIVACRIAGITAAIAMVADCLTVATLHLHVLYSILVHVYAFFLHAASELFDVFRGKKRNPLHGGRLDNAEHEVDQLFVGTILFTLLVFLFPTVLLYYLACAVPFFFVHCTKTIIKKLVDIFYDLPLYTECMRHIDASYAPGGILIDVRPRKHHLRQIRASAITVREAWAPVVNHIQSLVHLLPDAYALLIGARIS